MIYREKYKNLIRKFLLLTIAEQLVSDQFPSPDENNEKDSKVY